MSTSSAPRSSTCTALETLAIVRSYRRGPDITLVHPTAKITIAPPTPWLPLDRVAARAALVIEKIKLPVESAVLAMEKHYDAMAPGEQAAWREIWQLIEDPKRTQLPASTLYVAVDALLTRDRYAFDWADQLAAAIHSRALAENTLAITRSEV